MNHLRAGGRGYAEMVRESRSRVSFHAGMGEKRERNLGNSLRRRSWRTVRWWVVECYGQGEIHHEIVKKLNITEEPGAPLILFVYKVSRETEDLRNALQWIEGNTGREKEDICAVILLEKCLGKQNLSMAVAHQGVFGTNSVVVRIFWEQQRNSSGKILKDSSNKTAMAKVREKIMERQGSPAGGGH
ncbi:uncharacterized protein LOC134341175 isoform X2 [Mobula hypostoma]|uniref:uncharacterized protein LOC134341175 isoform X2 n=1 Tax=Mobula hypostoma TaxID=723540 RepID=UPI002FC3046A